MAYSLAPDLEMPDDFVVIYMYLGSIVLPYFSIDINYTALEVNYPIYYYCMFKILFSCIAFQPRFSQPFPPNSHLPQSHPTLVTLRKKAGLPATTNKCYIASYDKTRHIPSHPGGIRQLSERKGVLQAGQRARPMLPLLGIPQEHFFKK